MKPVAVVLMLLPFAFAAACYLFPYSEKAEVVLGFWAFCTVACLACGFVIRRKHPGLAWACVGIGFLQLVLMLLPALKREKAHAAADSTAQAIWPNPWLQATPSCALLFVVARWPGAAALIVGRHSGA